MVFLWFFDISSPRETLNLIRQYPEPIKTYGFPLVFRHFPLPEIPETTSSLQVRISGFSHDGFARTKPLEWSGVCTRSAAPDAHEQRARTQAHACLRRQCKEQVRERIVSA